MEFLVSVIIPVYNVESYLKRCLKSVVSQSYENMEIILVDDGSTDSSPQICDDWAKKDKKIRVIHKENGGLSDARNVGMEMAQGAYLAFVDSDDVIDPDFIELLLKTAYEQKADIVECGVQRFSDENCSARSEKLEKSRKIFSPEEAMKELINDGDIRQHVWNKLYRRETVGDIRFPVGKLNEDEFWTYKIIGKAERICRISEILYGYYQHPESIMGTKYGIRRLDALEAKEERMEYIERYYPGLARIAKYNFYISCRYAGQMCLKYLESSREKKLALCKVKTIYKRNKMEINDIKEKKITEKIWYLIISINFVCCCRFRNLLHIGI